VFGKTVGKMGQYQEGEFGAADFSTENCCLVTIPCMSVKTQTAINSLLQLENQTNRPIEQH